MARRSIRLILLLAAVPVLALGPTACSWSFHSGTTPADGRGRPAPKGKAAAGAPTDDAGARGKPVVDAHGASDADADPVAADPPNDAPAESPTDPGEGTAGTRLDVTAACRVHDSVLESLCHRALDPIAADDIDAFVAVLDDAVVLTRPSHERGTQRLVGPKMVRTVAMKAGGLRSFVHLDPDDRLVGTVSNDCRGCRRSFVAFQANTRSGTMVISLDLGQPATVFAVEIDSQVRRRRIGGERDSGADAPSTTITPRAEEPTTRRSNLIAPKDPTEEPPARKQVPR